MCVCKKRLPFFIWWYIEETWKRWEKRESHNFVVEFTWLSSVVTHVRREFTEKIYYNREQKAMNKQKNWSVHVLKLATMTQTMNQPWHNFLVTSTAIYRSNLTANRVFNFNESSHNLFDVYDLMNFIVCMCVCWGGLLFLFRCVA